MNNSILSINYYKTVFGIGKETFNVMLKILENVYRKEHSKGGRKDGTNPRQRLEITLKYIRQYLSQRYLAFEYSTSKSCISPIIKWTLKALINNNNFSLFNRILRINDISEARIIDATDSRIDRPRKKQKIYYSGKRKSHTLKVQIEIGEKTNMIYSINFSRGSVHDFKLYKQSKPDFLIDNYVIVDKGYSGIEKIHENSLSPIKATKNHKLSSDEKWYNSNVSKIRIAVEHVNCFLKKFKILGTKFRNRRKNYKLFVTFICCIYNFERA